ncbi:heme oxygenase (biliverdin-producing) [Streptomyces catenulae]|uniref:Biliverdin-producing heme oxygenase n=1 Tax=Streptomyces catenulae TaxID=66875 RepID=A0ABV2YWU0_9ACTN|nr:biliverdin-producing heme oxygenase [Streptomyces catenulae]
MRSTASPAPAPFSTQLRTASRPQHDATSGDSFLADLIGARLGVTAFRGYTEQLWFVYDALEEEAGRLARDPVAGPFVRPELTRAPELARDLAHFHGPSWRSRVAPLPETVAYTDRIRHCARHWPGGYVAHHYTRYLGDLSGGQVLRATAEKEWGFAPKGDGVRFYVFEGIANPAAFKREYRALLDAVRADDLERQRIIDECRRAFALNDAVFRALSERFPLSA